MTDTAERTAEHEIVQDYYGKQLSSSADLKTTACCDATPPPAHIRAALADIHPEVTNRYYGCGLVVPEVLEGASVLDLGCGTGRDVYLLSALVGETGRVIGVDMTEEQLAVARETQDWHRARFGHAASNVTFLKGVIEDLGALGLAPGSVDLVVSNCVVNLAADKQAVLRGVHDLLKPGGELYFSDVYSDRRIPDALRADPVLYGECLSGALYTGDFLRLARAAGFTCPRRVSTRTLDITVPDVAAKLGDIRFVSEVWRLFKTEGLEDAREDYGQTATYLGGITEADAALVLDESLTLGKGQPTPIDANMAAMLGASRYAPYVEISPPGPHRGAFDAPEIAPASGGCCG